MLDEAADTITRLTAEVERLTKGRETMGNLWARERAARVAAEAEVGWLEAARAPEMADEITNLRAAQSNLIGTNRMLKQQVEDRDTTITRLTAEVERLRESIDNAQQAASETHPSWKNRCYSILRALGIDCGDPDWMMPDDLKKLELAEAENERLRAALKHYACECWGNVKCYHECSPCGSWARDALEYKGAPTPGNACMDRAALKEPRT
jgi:chromosome segregation ATPase